MRWAKTVRSNAKKDPIASIFIMKNIARSILLISIIEREAFANVYRSTPSSMYPSKRPVLTTLNPPAVELPKPPPAQPYRRSELQVDLIGVSRKQRSTVGASDYSEAARILFGGFITPAAILVAGLIPLSFFADPLPDNTPIRKKLGCLYYFLAVTSLTNELLAIMYATVARNRLTETAGAPATSVFTLISRDLELSWIGTNVHFISGLLGFVGMILIRAHELFPPDLNLEAAGMGAAALLAMVSVGNVGVAEAVGRKHAWNGNLLSLYVRYVVLIAKHLFYNGGVVALAAFALALVSSVSAMLTLLSPETYTPTH